MPRNFFKFSLWLIALWSICVPMFCQVFDTMTSKESEEARTRLIEYSKTFVGTPYQYGGASKNGMDCSGFVFTVVNDSLGIKLPRSASALYAKVRIIPDNEKEAGDLLFFKTVEDKISHVGIYLGKDQFIHAASDGPNTGVIVSSLKESYWKRTYTGAGRFLPSAKGQQGSIAKSYEKEGNVEERSSKNTHGFSGFLGKLVIESTLTGDWTFFTSHSFALVSRGFSLDVHGRYNDFTLQPGIGISLSYDPAMNLFKIPLVFSFTVLEKIRVYAGPVFSIGKAVAPGTKNFSTPQRVQASIFPGILGVAFQTPTIKAGPVDLSIVQDIRYSVYNNTEGAALSFLDSMSAGLVFATGVRVTFPLSKVL